MEHVLRENTLFLGNGFSRSVFREVPSWGELFDGASTSVKNYAILYEKFFLQKKWNGKTEEEVKQDLMKRIQNRFSGKDIRDGICNLDRFGVYLKNHNINNIITTNYDKGIESILCELCGFEEEKPSDLVSERIYSIRTYRLFVNKNTGHEIKLWKIHGDLDRICSITLGFDHYCGTLSKLSEYIKGTYRTSKTKQNLAYAGSMENKCRKQIFDGISWAELFFRTNLYIVGFGLDFSEIDIWWLLNKRARMMVDIQEIDNKIFYLYNKKFERPDLSIRDELTSERNHQSKFETLDAFHVIHCPMIDSSDYIYSIFATIDQCESDK